MNGTERDLATYLKAVRSRPGAKLQILTVLGFGVGVVVKSGWLVAFAILIGCLLAGLTFGYWRFKRTGRIF